MTSRPLRQDETPAFATGLARGAGRRQSRPSLSSEMPDHDEDTGPEPRGPATAPSSPVGAAPGSLRRPHGRAEEPDAPLEAESEPSGARQCRTRPRARQASLRAQPGRRHAHRASPWPPSLLSLLHGRAAGGARPRRRRRDARHGRALRLAAPSPATGRRRCSACLGVPGVMVAAYFKGPEAIVAGFVVFIVAGDGRGTWPGITHRSPARQPLGDRARLRLDRCSGRLRRAAPRPEDLPGPPRDRLPARCHHRRRRLRHRRLRHRQPSRSAQPRRPR